MLTISTETKNLITSQTIKQLYQTLANLRILYKTASEYDRKEIIKNANRIKDRIRHEKDRIKFDIVGICGDVVEEIF